MSTITSPRQSVTSLSTSTDSRRTSLDTPLARSRANSPALGPPQRRNKAALRDYYGLKGAAPADASNGSQHEEAEVRTSELDAEGFDAEAYVKGLLAREGLAGLLKIEGGLINGTLPPSGFVRMRSSWKISCY